MDGHIKRLTLVSNLVDTNTLITLPTPLETPAPSTSTTSTFPNPVRQANPRLSLAFSRRNSSALLPGALYLPPSSPRSPLSPTRTPPRSPFHGHVRRSTYAGDISPGFSRPPMLNVEEKIAILESTNKRLSIELAETKDALSIEREGQVSHASSRRSSQRSPSPSGHDLLHEAEQLHHERNLRVEVLDSLKKVRTYNGVLSRSIREHQEQSESLASLLEEERTHREMAQDEIAKLERVNFTLYEHNRLLVARDLAFQRMTDSVHPEPSPCISQDASSSILGSHQPLYALRNDLNAARDELHIVKMDLNASEEARAMLSERVTALQREMSHCLDSSSQALQTERELRDEVLERLRQKEDEVEILQRKLQGREEKVPVKNNDSATLDRQTSHLNSSVCFRQRVHKRLERRRQRRTRLVTLPCSQPRDETILSPENSLSRLSSPSLLLSILTQQNLGSLPTKTFGRPSTQRIPSVIKQILVSPTSTVSTLVCSSNVTSLAVDAKPHRSVLLSATLSRKLGKSMKAEALKADSTCSIDVMNTNGYGHTDAHSVSQHASLVLTNLALQDSGWEVVDGPVIM